MAIGSFSCTKKIENYFELEDENEQSMLKSSNGTEFFYIDKGEKEFFNIRNDKVIIKTRSVENAQKICKQETFIKKRVSINFYNNFKFLNHVSYEQ